jgi:hypothetical protein
VPDDQASAKDVQDRDDAILFAHAKSSGQQPVYEVVGSSDADD